MKQLSNFFDRLHRIMKHPRTRQFIFGLFIVQAAVLVFVTQFGVPPDETNHIEFVKFYADYSPGPIFSEQTPTWNLGDKTREVDYLYHYVMSWVLRLSPLPDHASFYIIRFVSVVLACLTFIILVKLWRRLGVGDATINTALLALTNIPMVLMMSMAVNNDVAVWVFTAASLLLLVKLWQEPRPIDALLLLSLSVYGGLVKRTLMPLGCVAAILVVFFVLRKWHDVKQQLHWPDWRLIACGIVFVIGAGLFVERVGGNLLTYGAIAPKCEQVQGDKACSVFWVNARSESFKTGEEADKWLAGGVTKDKELIPLPVFVVSWAVDSFNNIVDIQAQGWRHHVTPPIWLGPLLLAVMTVAIGIGVVHDGNTVRREQLARGRLAVTVLALMIIISLLVVNYLSYRRYHIFGLALNGRYLLPAILPLAGLSFWYGGKLLARPWRQLAAVVIIVSIMVGSGLVMMLRNPQLFTG